MIVPSPKLPSSPGGSIDLQAPCETSRGLCLVLANGAQIHSRRSAPTLQSVAREGRARMDEHVLAELGRVLVAADLDPTRMLSGVAELVARSMSDWCIVDLLRGGAIHRVHVVHRHPSMKAACQALVRCRGQDPQDPVAKVLATGQSLVTSEEAPTADLDARDVSDDDRRLVRELDGGSMMYVPLATRGQTLGVLAFGASRSSLPFDATDLRLAEEIASRVSLALRSAMLHERLAQGVRERDEVLAMVAHDLRNPLTAIVMQAGQLRRRGDEPERRDQQPAERIRRAAVRMNRLIQDLLDTGRLDAGERLFTAPEAIPVGRLLAEAVELQQPAITHARRTLTVESAGALPSVWADRERTLQVLDNLLGNAAKFSRRRVTLRATREGDEVKLSIADDGPGVPAEDLPHLFDRFWQATKADRRGAGLGLWIVKGIVDAHGGRVWAESEIGVGTTFHFTLPVAG